MDVYLYNVGRNLNRAFRTCFSFGIKNLFMIGKSEDRSIKWELKGNLYSAKEKVNVYYLNEIPRDKKLIAFENFYNLSMYTLCNSDWIYSDGIIIGGESTGIPKNESFFKNVCIPTVNSFCLTVEASLAIALNEWRRNVN